MAPYATSSRLGKHHAPSASNSGPFAIPNRPAGVSYPTHSSRDSNLKFNSSARPFKDSAPRIKSHLDYGQYLESPRNQRRIFGGARQRRRQNIAMMIACISILFLAIMGIYWMVTRVMA